MSGSAINHFTIILHANPKISSEYERCVRSDEGGGVKYGFRDAFLIRMLERIDIHHYFKVPTRIADDAPYGCRIKGIEAAKSS
ncbi:MAG: hypothetical protein GY845_25570 [Planctomycetes bacterium]|nr:hypothetical protein [Planctomycetota bacterium]